MRIKLTLSQLKTAILKTGKLHYPVVFVNSSVDFDSYVTFLEKEGLK